MNVVVIGASNKPERYAYRAVEELMRAGHQVYPVHPRLESVQGLRVFHSVEEIPGPVDTVTMYVGAAGSKGMIPAIVRLKPRRLIINPGAESPQLEAEATRAGIHVIHACTLVMLKTGQF